MIRFINVIIFSAILISCHSGEKSYSEQLQNLDGMLEDQSKIVLDSLKTIDVSHLNKGEKAYYYLLEASAMDKNFISSPNDSMLRVTIKYYTDKQDYYNLTRSQYYLARLLAKDEKESAYDLLKQAEISFNKSDQTDTHLAGLIYFQLATIQDQQNNFTESTTFHKKALDIFLKAKDTILAVHSLKQLSHIFINQKEYDKAQELLTEGLRLITSINDNKSRIIVEAKAGTLSSFSILYRKKSDIANALKYAKESVSVFQQAGLKTPASYYHNLLIAFKNQGETDSVKYYCQELIEVAQADNKFVNLMNGYKILFELEEEKGNYKEACILKDKFNEYKDQHNVKNKSDSFIKLEKKYNLAEKEREILKAENKNLWLSIFVLVLILIVTIIGLHFYHRHRKLKVEYQELSEGVKHTKWGFSVYKELINDNHNSYDELERILARNRIHSVNTKLYNEFQEVFKTQKTNYSAHLFSTLTDFDDAFIKKIQYEFPELNPEDVMMAAMIRHQWSTSDISAVFRSSIEAIRKRKSRLNKKILGKEENSNTQLEDYLSKM